MTLQIDSDTYRSPNFNARPAGKGIDSIVLHSTEGKWPSDIEWLCNPQTSGKYQPVSCHYVISPDAGIYRIVDESKRAWHAGFGSYLGIADWNNTSIGIEVSRKKGDPWSQAQREALRLLCLDLIARHDIKQSRIAAHRWIAPLRRSDPTDWDNAGLMAWIEELYVEDWATRWGTKVPYFSASGIATAWRDAWRSGTELGQAVSDELPISTGVVRCFAKGWVSWSQSAGIRVGQW